LELYQLPAIQRRRSDNSGACAHTTARKPNASADKIVEQISSRIDGFGFMTMERTGPQAWLVRM